MKLSSVLFGDWADLFQDSRILDAEQSARSAASTANRNHAQLTQLVEVAEKRLREVERENVLLGVLLAGVLRQLAKSDPVAAQTLLDETGSLLRGESAPASLNFLRQLLNLPPQEKTPLSIYTKPRVIAPRPVPKPLPARAVKKPLPFFPKKQATPTGMISGKK